MELYVSVNGDDSNDGSQSTPFKTIEMARDFVRQSHVKGNEPIIVKILEGSYYLKKPIVFTAEDNGSKHAPVTYEGIGNVRISGGVRLELQWEVYRDGIYRAKVIPDISIDQFFINGKKKILARYPDYDENSRYYNGYSADSFDMKRVEKYKNPAGGYMHAMHQGLWGDFHYEITGKKEDGRLEYYGGHQNNRPSDMHDSIRYIENILEELDSPNEWYFDRNSRMLYYKPKSKSELAADLYEGAVLKNIISFLGTAQEPVRYITLVNLQFVHAVRTFMEPMERVLRSDWCIYRGGAVFLEGTENVVIERCGFTQVGGNGVTFSGYNNQSSLRQSLIMDAEANSVLVIGKSLAVRSPLYSYGEIHSDIKQIDMEPGPKTEDYPRKCIIEDNLLIRNGRTEKQSAAICLSICREIHIKHNTIYEVPRAGINICDGTWGGHCIEENQVFHTVLETSDHGAFNSWGRDRYWDFRYEVMEQRLSQYPDFPLLDAMSPTLIRNNLFQCDHGWDIDLDDGSSNYMIEGNLCLQGGIKNREGILRKVRNNIIINNTFHPHVWFCQSKDCFERNLVFKPYADIGLKEWGDVFDYNILYKTGNKCSAEKLQIKSGKDAHSICAKIEFADLPRGNVLIENTDEIQEIGFINIDTSSWGVQYPELKKIAENPFKKRYQVEEYREVDNEIYELEGMRIKKLSGLGELSATGMYQETGIFVSDINQDSKWYQRGIRPKDVILNIDGQDLDDVGMAMECLKRETKQIVIWREQGKRLI